MIKSVDMNTLVNMNKDGVIVADFFAKWCRPCKMLSPILEELSDELKENARFIKIDIDYCPDLSEIFHISTIPTVMIIKDGKVEDMIVGFRPKEELQKTIKGFVD